METDSVRWTFGPHTNWFSRIVAYAPYGLVGGLGLLFVAGVVVLTVSGSVGGSTLVLFLILLLVGGPVSLLYVFFLARYGSNPSRWFEQFVGTGRLTTRGLAISTLVGAVLVVASVAVSGRLAAGLLIGAVVSSLLARSLETEATLAPAERRLTLGDESRVGGTTVIDLDDVTGVRRVSLGPLSNWRLTLLRRVGGPPLVVPVPTEHAGAFDRALETGLAATPVSEPKTAGTTRPMRIVLAAIGLGFLALAVGFGALVVETGETAGGRAFYPVLLLAMFAAITLGYAGYESWLARRSEPPSDE